MTLILFVNIIILFLVCLFLHTYWTHTQRVEIVLPTFPKSRRTIHYFKMGIFHIMHCTREGHLAYTPPEYCEQYLNSRDSTINRWRY